MSVSQMTPQFLFEVLLKNGTVLEKLASISIILYRQLRVLFLRLVYLFIIELWQYISAPGSYTMVIFRAKKNLKMIFQRRKCKKSCSKIWIFVTSSFDTNFL